MSVVYDAGVLIAAEREDRGVWADHRARLEFGIAPTTTAAVVAQVSRSPRQVQLRRLLRGCDIVGFSPDQAHEVGKLLADAGTSDVIDAHVVLTADRTHATVITADEEDLRQLSDSLTLRVPIRPVGRPPRRRRR